MDRMDIPTATTGRTMITKPGALGRGFGRIEAHLNHSWETRVSSCCDER